MTIFNRGFTLLEVLIVVLVLTIVLVIAVPSFVPTIQGNRLGADAAEFGIDLNFARSEAINRRQSVSVCAHAGNNACRREGGNWNDGWIVFTDFNSDGIPSVGSGLCRTSPTAQEDCILRVKQAISTGNVLHNSDNLPFISFRADGSVANVATATRFRVCTDRDVGENKERELTVNNLGNVTETKHFTCP